MTFSSVTFLFMFLPVVFILYGAIRNTQIRNIILAASSIIFYAYGEPVAVIIMLISIVLNYVFGLMASGTKHDRLAVALAVILNIGLLMGYKYTGFFAEIFNSVTGLGIPVPHIRLPIGISFFTFQGLSYVIDVYRDKMNVQRSLFSVLLYISFFPQLIAGPIVRYADIADRLHDREFTADRVSRGVLRFIFGLSKKLLIANQMGYVADMVFSMAPSDVGMGQAWIGAVFYSLQVFFDFSGYSDMAIGLGCIFGFDFKENFNYPFIAPNIQDFWRRWHISLSTWFKEYVYIPLGGSRKGELRTTLNKLVVFFLTGFWHGANFTFIVWGIYHGILQMLETYQIIPTKKKWFRPFTHIYLLLAVEVSFVIFRADNLTQAFSLIANMFNGNPGDAVSNAQIMASLNPMTILSFIFAVILCTPVFKTLRSKMTGTRYENTYNYLAYIGALILFILCILSLVSSKYNPFIYFRF